MTLDTRKLMSSVVAVMCMTAVNVFAADVVDHVKVDGTEVEFVNGYYLDGCLEYDRLRKRVEKIDPRTCNGLRNHQTRKFAEAEAARQRTEQAKAQAEQFRLKQEEARAGREAEQQQRDLRYQQRQEAKRQYDECLALDTYALFEVSRTIREALETLRNIAALQAKERQIQRESGVRSMTRDYELSREKIEVSAELKTNWREYKQQGGKGVRPEDVPVLLNPCEKLESVISGGQH